MITDKLIVMDGVSGLGDKSDEFANFLTVPRKYGVTCVYIFNTIYPSRQNWQMIMSQSQIFNFFQTLFIAVQLLELYPFLLTGIKIPMYLYVMFG